MKAGCRPCAVTGLSRLTTSAIADHFLPRQLHLFVQFRQSERIIR